MASAYERQTGGCTRVLAAQMLSIISPPITSNSYILDSACGPGIVTAEIKAVHPEAKIMATDLSPAMISETQTRIKAEGWSDVETDTLNGRSLKSLADGNFSHVFVNLGLHVFANRDDSVQAVREVFRVLKLGGVAMLTTWADRVWLSAYYATARSIRPQEEPQKGIAFSPQLLHGSWLVAVLEEGGFGNNVELRRCVTYTSAKSLEELMEKFMVAKGTFFGGYSEEELERARPVLKEELRKLRTYEEVDGEVRIGMKAWIGTGWKKGDEAEVPL